MAGMGVKRLIVLRKVGTGDYKYYWGIPTEYKSESYPGYIYAGSFLNERRAREEISHRRPTQRV
jgi:hypothetical protein